jgi:hypothetical protein
MLSKVCSLDNSVSRLSAALNSACLHFLQAYRRCSDATAKKHWDFWYNFLKKNCTHGHNCSRCAQLNATHALAHSNALTAQTSSVLRQGAGIAASTL